MTPSPASLEKAQRLVVDWYLKRDFPRPIIWQGELMPLADQFALAQKEKP